MGEIDTQMQDLLSKQGDPPNPPRGILTQWLELIWIYCGLPQGYGAFNPMRVPPSLRSLRPSR